LGAATSVLPFDASAAAVKSALESLPGIFQVIVDRSSQQVDGGFQWDVTVVSATEDASARSLIYGEARLLTGLGARIRTVPICPSSEQFETAYGRLGEAFFSELTGPATVYPSFVYRGAQFPGEYEFTYVAPEAGSYQLDVERGIVGGLQATYYSNRWLQGDPVLSRVDSTLDFAWPAEVAGSSRDYVSARWRGKLVVPVEEVYTFYVHVNDGARLWINGNLLIDQFESSIDEAIAADMPTFATIPYVEFSNSTRTSLDPNVMHDIVLEYRENTGGSVLRLLYESTTMGKQVIPSERLYYSTERIASSPFFVEPEGVVPFAPERLEISIESE